MKPIIQFLVILGVGIATILGTIWFANQIKEPQVVEKIVEKPVVLPLPTCPRSFEIYQNLVKGDQSVQLIENKKSYASGGKLTLSYEVPVKRSGQGLVACGYLYVKARVGNQKLDEKFDSIYIDPQGFGGHLLRPRSMPIPNSTEYVTEILLPLDAVPYLPTVPYDPNAQGYKIADWARLLNVSDELKFTIALSTLNRSGVIDEVRIAYKCWDSNTGLETQDCQLSK